MGLKKTREAASQNSGEDFENEESLAEPEDNESGEDTSSDEDYSADDQSDQESDEDDEQVKLSKAEHDKLVRERDSYKTGMLKALGKKRQLSSSDDESPPKKKKVEVDVTEDAVTRVLEKRSENTALQQVVNPDSKHYIADLVDEDNYNEIIGYLPRNIDRSSPESVVRALRIATKIWQEDKGIKVDKAKNNKSRDLANTKSSSAGAGSAARIKTGRKLLRSSAGIGGWYK